MYSPDNNDSNLFQKFLHESRTKDHLKRFDAGTSDSIASFLMVRTRADALFGLRDQEQQSPFWSSLMGDTNDEERLLKKEKNILLEEMEALRQEKSQLVSEVSKLKKQKKRMRHEDNQRVESSVLVDVVTMGKTVKSLDLEFALVSADEEDDDESYGDDYDLAFALPSINTRRQKRRRVTHNLASC